MSRISRTALAQAIAAVRAMDMKQKEQLADELFRAQPHLFRQMQRFIASVKFGDDLGTSLREQSMRQYIEGHPEKELLAYVQVETANWLHRIVPQETDKYVMMAAANFVNCIAFVPMRAPKSAPCRRRTG